MMRKTLDKKWAILLIAETVVALVFVNTVLATQPDTPYVVTVCRGSGVNLHVTVYERRSHKLIVDLTNVARNFVIGDTHKARALAISVLDYCDTQGATPPPTLTGEGT
jgi:hypothetical protein